MVLATGNAIQMRRHYSKFLIQPSNGVLINITGQFPYNTTDTSGNLRVGILKYLKGWWAGTYRSWKFTLFMEQIVSYSYFQKAVKRTLHIILYSFYAVKN
jgi:hypothetical protein